MSKSINKSILLGNVGQVESKTLSTGTLLTTVSVATNDRYKKGEEWVDRVEWHSVLCYGRTGEIARDYLRKGSKLYVEGRIQTDKWESKDGQKHYRTYVVAGELVLLDSRERHEPPAEFAPPPKKSIDEQLNTYSPTAEISDDDIPF